MSEGKICFSKKTLKTFVYVLTIIAATLVFGIYMYRNSYPSKANTTTTEQACNNLPGCWGGKTCIPVFNNTLPTKSYNSGYCCFGADQGIRKLPYPHFEKVTDNKCNLVLQLTNTPTPAKCTQGQNDTYGKNYCNDCAGNIKYGQCIKYGQDWKRCKQCYNSSYNCLIVDKNCPANTIAITIIPTLSPTISIPTESNKNYFSNTCKQKGIKKYKTQPLNLDNELCEDGSLGVRYKKDYEPSALVDIKSSLSNNYLIVSNLKGREKAVTTLKTFLDLIKSDYNMKHKCMPRVNSAYRSYLEQEQMFKGNCIWDDINQRSCDKSGYPNQCNLCQYGRPGSSMHQSGIAFDITCAKNVGSTYSQTETDWDQAVITNVPNISDIMQKTGFIHPIDWDLVHFVYVY